MLFSISTRCVLISFFAEFKLSASGAANFLLNEAAFLNRSISGTLSSYSSMNGLIKTVGGFSILSS